MPASAVSILQAERAFQKQAMINVAKLAPKQSKKDAAKKKKVKVNARKTVRYHRDVGLGVRTPREAKEGDYVDKKCPFTGNVSIRGRILRGIVISTKMQNTLVVRRDYLHYVRKYQRYEKRHKNISAHCTPALRVKVGDMVEIGECRPLSKTVRFNVLRIAKLAEGSKDFSKF